jgi:hypothetical protein
MKRKLLKRIFVIGIMLCSVQLFNSCEGESAISFSNESLESIEKIDLSGVISFNYKKDDTQVVTDDVAVKLQDTLASYTNTVSADTFDIDSSTGAFLFNKGISAYKGDNNTPALPSASEAANIAEEHLANLNIAPDTYNNAYNEREVTHIGGLSMASVDKYGVTATYEKLVAVSYQRKLAGLPVMGGSRIIVQLGSEGELAGLVWNWPEIDENDLLDTVNTIQKTEISQYIIETLQSVYAKNAENISSVLIKSVELVMYDDDKEGVIEPALFIVGEISESNGTTYHTDCLLPVLKDYKASYPVFATPAVMPDVDCD